MTPSEPQLECEYCGRSRPFSTLELRNDKLVCIDRGACDAAEEGQHKEYLAELRKRQRDGDELSDAEKGELADA